MASTEISFTDKADSHWEMWASKPRSEEGMVVECTAGSLDMLSQVCKHADTYE